MSRPSTAGSSQVSKPGPGAWRASTKRGECTTRAGGWPSWRWRASSWSTIWGWASPPMDPSTASSAPSGRVIRAGASVWGGRRPGPYRAGCPGATAKPMPRLCRLMPVRGSNRPEPKPEALLWMSDTPMRSPSTTARWMVPPAAPGDATAATASGRMRARRRSSSTGSSSASGSAPAWSRSGRSKPARRALSASRWAQAGSPGGVGQVEALGDERAGQAQVALRRRGHGPHVGAPDPTAQRRHPVGQRSRQVRTGGTRRPPAPAGPGRTRPGRSRRVPPPPPLAGPGPRRAGAPDRPRRRRAPTRKSPAPGRSATSGTMAASMVEAGKPSAA